MAARRALTVLASAASALALVAGYLWLAAASADQFANRATEALRSDAVRSLVARRVTDDIVLSRQADLLAARPLIESVTEAVVGGLARHIELVGKPLCPCNFYPDPQAEAKSRRWICACDEMQKWKYCHCLLFVTPEGLPITEYLPEDHEGRHAYGVVKDPTPDKGRATAKVLERQQTEGT